MSELPPVAHIDKRYTINVLRWKVPERMPTAALADFFATLGLTVAMLTVVVGLTASMAGAATAVEEARGMIAADNLDGAIRHLEAFTDEHPTDAEALYVLGYAYYTRGEMERAAKRFREAYLVNPELVPPVSVGSGPP